jgi:protein gp37
MVFVNSMSDLFHEAIPKEYIAAVFGVMAAAEQHTFQVLTKRPERMREWFAWYAEEVRDREEGWSPGAAAIQEARRAGVDERYLYCRDDDLGWPLPNVWLGVSIENRRYIGRADLLRETPAAVRFISAEPLLGPLVHEGGCIDDDGRSYWYEDYTGPQLDLTGIDWLITGGESGPKHRRLDLEWVRDLRDAAVASGTAFFHKQHGGRTPKAGGRELDGREWSEFPSVPGEGTGS